MKVCMNDIQMYVLHQPCCHCHVIYSISCVKWMCTSESRQK